MQIQPLSLPRLAPPARFRQPKKNIPQTILHRNQMLQQVRHYVKEFALVPPMPMDELRRHAEKLVAMLGCDPIYRDYLGVLMNNEMWRETLATVPYQRRLLLL